MVETILTNIAIIGNATDALNNASEVIKDVETIKNINIVTNILYVLATTLIGVIIFLWRSNSKLSEKIETITIDHSLQIDSIRVKNAVDIADLTKRYGDKIEDIRVETMDSEKSTLQILNGVSKIIEMGEKTGRYDYEKISTQINTLENRVMDSLNNLSNKLD